MMAGVEARVTSSVVRIVLLAVAGGITLVAVAYAIYAALREPLSAAGASAVTAFIFALVTAALAVLGPKLIRGRTASPKRHEVAVHPTIDPTVKNRT